MTALVDRILAIDEALEAGGIPHAFGGALALAYHTDEPRGTRDIDVNVFLPTDQARRVFEALPVEVRWSEDDLRRVDADAQVRLFWDDTPVDLFFTNHEFHEQAAARTGRVPFSSREIPILGADELTVFKAFFNRTKDWADIEAMNVVGSFDPHRVLGWLIDLLGGDDERVERMQQLVRQPHATGALRFEPRIRRPDPSRLDETADDPEP